MGVSVEVFILFFFFFQAEDGIRDYKVTGVQTCALPICALADLLLNRPNVEDVDVAADRLHVEPHRGHLALEALPGLLERHIEALRAAFPRVPMENRIAQCRLHRPGEAREEHDMADGEPAPEDVVESLDVCGDFLRLHVSSSSSGTA